MWRFSFSSQFITKHQVVIQRQRLRQQWRKTFCRFWHCASVEILMNKAVSKVCGHNLAFKQGEIVLSCFIFYDFTHLYVGIFVPQADDIGAMVDRLNVQNLNEKVAVEVSPEHFNLCSWNYVFMSNHFCELLSTFSWMCSSHLMQNLVFFKLFNLIWQIQLITAFQEWNVTSNLILILTTAFQE